MALGGRVRDRDYDPPLYFMDLLLKSLGGRVRDRDYDPPLYFMDLVLRSLGGRVRDRDTTLHGFVVFKFSRRRSALFWGVCMLARVQTVDSPSSVLTGLSGSLKYIANGPKFPPFSQSIAVF